MNILSVELRSESFKSLKKFERELRFDLSPNDIFDPVCLVGLNGSGKSQFLELIAEIFMVSEYFIRNNKSPSFEGDTLLFKIVYSLDASTRRFIQIVRQSKNDFVFSEGSSLDNLKVVESPDLNILPRKIFGYSSGMNETLSAPFLQLHDDFSSKLGLFARKKETYNEYVQPVNMSYISHDIGLILALINFIYKSENQVLKEYTNLKRLVSFEIHINRKPRILIQTNFQLDEVIEGLEKSAFRVKTGDTEFHKVLEFKVNEELELALYKHFGKPGLFFDSISLLNNLNILGIPKKMIEWIKKQRRSGQIIKNPILQDDDKFFRVSNVIFETANGQEIQYEGLSDGEHQLLVTLGTLSIIDETDALFLFDEPSTHYNPMWRSELLAEYSKVAKERNQEIVLTTHSPFIVSSVRSEMVYHFDKNRKQRIMKPNFETFGCDINIILNRLFGETSLIPSLPSEKIKELAKKSPDEILAQIDQFGESHAKAMLYKKLEELG